MKNKIRSLSHIFPFIKIEINLIFLARVLSIYTLEIILTISVLLLQLLPKLLIIWPNNIVIRGMPNPLAMAPTVPTIINATSVESANEKSLRSGTAWVFSSPSMLELFSTSVFFFFWKKRERKRTWLIAIRNFDTYIYKCHQRRNYQINRDIYCFLEQIEIIKLLEIYTIFWDRFILITSCRIWIVLIP